jgi:histidyl-tRNA synthetase
MFKTIKGTKDILPAEIHKWHFIENTIRRVFRNFGYQEIRTPVFEETALFKRGIGETTDIVGKEMFSFQPDPNSESLTLRPEMTASVMRAHMQHNLSNISATTKLYYISELFRKERPQAGRQRQFWQFGSECIGSQQPESDAETIALMMAIFDALGVQNVQLKLNSLGSTESRMAYRETLREYLRPFYDKLDDISKVRFESNPMRILDSKNPDLQEIISDAPNIVDVLDEPSKTYFQDVQNYLKDYEIEAELDPRLVRGLDYYSHTAFELISNNLGAQNALAGGGRYDGLSGILGSKKPIPAVGFAAGIERLIIIMEKNGLFESVPVQTPGVYVALQTQEAKKWAFKTVNQFRKKGISSEIDLQGRSLKAQMREANRLGAHYVIVVGQAELDNQKFQLKHLATSEQMELSIEDIEDKLLSYCSLSTATS